MKKTILILAAAAIFVACGPKKVEPAVEVVQEEQTIEQPTTDEVEENVEQPAAE